VDLAIVDIDLTLLKPSPTLAPPTPPPPTPQPTPPPLADSILALVAFYEAWAKRVGDDVCADSGDDSGTDVYGVHKGTMAQSAC
jgi:hypothetical protein